MRLTLCALALASADTGRADESGVQLPRPNLPDPITIAADTAARWQQGAYDVWLLRGHCLVNQGLTYARSREAVLWIEHGDPESNRPTTVTAYLEGDVDIRFHQGAGDGAGHTGRLADKSWFGRFSTTATLQIRPTSPEAEPRLKPAIFHRGMAQFDPDHGQSIRQTQFTEFGPSVAPTDPLPRGTRRIQAFPRSDVRFQAQSQKSPTGDGSITVITSGVNLIVDGVEVEGLGNVGSIDVATDRLVIWTAGRQTDLTGQTLQTSDMPLEIYMEGNIVFRQGDREIYAHQMYYDVRNRVGVVLGAELLTPVPEYRGLLRLKADVLRQLDASRFVAHNAIITSSRMGSPSYHFQAGTIAYQDIQRPRVDPFTGAVDLDPATGRPLTDHQRLASSSNNFLFVSGIPVLYWPTMATDLTKPTYYVDRLQVKNDSVFGTQALLDLDAYQLFGIRNPPQGTDWDISLDYLSKRGLGAGTSVDYDRAALFGVPGQTIGHFEAWAIDDDGVDNLGRGWRALVPEEKFRGRVFSQHRQQLPGNFTLSNELGWISDRNFLAQFYEREWDENKDQTSGIELKRILDNRSWSITGDAQINDFFTETEWKPRLDHFWLGQSLWGDRLTWYEHSSAGYALLRSDVPPLNAAQLAQWRLLPWESNPAQLAINPEGERFVTRQEIDLPFQLGPTKIVPYALGELAHWGQVLGGGDLQRFYYQVGARASLPFWTVNPMVDSPLWNVHGLAHKVVFDAELSFAEANRNLALLPLYDPLDDNSVEQFRRRFYFTTFGLGLPTALPLKFDERFYALRTGLQDNVTSPSAEIADDLTALRLGMRHRWQTKRGYPGNQRVIDWITFDTNATYFPKEDRDNFGQKFGLVDYDFRWHVGDRTTVLSDGVADFFGGGLRTFHLGAILNRPPRGSLYLGFLSIEGPISSNVLAVSYNYHMSPKWVSSFGSTVDFGQTGNIGQNVSITRIGESLLVTLGFNVDASKGDIGARFMIEPRFLPKTRLSHTAGVQIAPAGAFGLE